MALFNIIRDLLKGKKTYVVGILAIVLGIYQKDTPIIVYGLGLVALRAGISKM